MKKTKKQRVSRTPVALVRLLDCSMDNTLQRESNDEGKISASNEGTKSVSHAEHEQDTGTGQWQTFSDMYRLVACVNE